MSTIYVIVFNINIRTYQSPLSEDSVIALGNQLQGDLLELGQGDFQVGENILQLGGGFLPVIITDVPFWLYFITYVLPCPLFGPEPPVDGPVRVGLPTPLQQDVRHLDEAFRERRQDGALRTYTNKNELVAQKNTSRKIRALQYGSDLSTNSLKSCFSSDITMPAMSERDSLCLIHEGGPRACPAG